MNRPAPCSKGLGPSAPLDQEAVDNVDDAARQVEANMAVPDYQTLYGHPASIAGWQLAFDYQKPKIAVKIFDAIRQAGVLKY
jgi:hypothetical protein